jgi:acylphosphatase
LVDKIFFINGEKIFDIAFRPALIQLADEVGIKAHATNLRDKEQVRVVASGSYSSVQTYYGNIVNKTNFPQTLEETIPDYSVSKMKDYNGPDIDWSGYNQQFMSAQLAKSVGFFAYLDKKIDAMHSDINKQCKNNKRTKHPTK